MKDKIVSEAKSLGIDLIGFTNAVVFSEIEPLLVERMDKGFLSPFLSSDMESHTDPIKVWEETKSIISIGMAYNNQLPDQKADNTVGTVSKVAWGRDYHHVLMDKMNFLMRRIVVEYPELKYKAYVDNAPLLDRAVANRCGIGFYGKNGFIINPIYGSYIFLGHILVNFELSKSKQLTHSYCGECNKCIQACPTSALKVEYGFDSNKCISYLTQKKEILNKWERKAIGKNIYGCDICQEVCPINKTTKIGNEKAFLPTTEFASPKLVDIINMSNSAFKETYWTSAAGWRGKKNLQRNAIIIAGNVKCSENYDLLIETLYDNRWEIRLYTLFSLLEYGEKGINIVNEKIINEDKQFVEKFDLFRA